MSLRREKVWLSTVWRSLSGDLETPIGAFMKLCPEGPAYLLESAAGGEQVSRYSFIGYNPFLTLKAKGGAVTLAWKDGTTVKCQGKPFEVVRDSLGQLESGRHPGLPRFAGGAVGYFAYDLAAQYEPLGVLPPDELGLPDVYLQFMQNMVIFDHFTHNLHLLVHRPSPGALNSPCDEQADAELEKMMAALGGMLPASAGYPPTNEQATVSVGQSEEEYVERVRVAKEHILAGDIFQIVLSQRCRVPLQDDPFAVYRRLRSLNPSPYMFFLRNPEVTLVGASPEMLVRVEGRTVTTRPIAGTRRRGSYPEEDRRLEAELLADGKEMAEHVMLVDLGRNDIGRVAGYGTVRVSEYARVERYSHVMHLVSEVTGELAEGKDALDALPACFPAGTLTGAPKVRAMQLINELEPVGRGPYGGAVGYLDFNGNMDACITIRTIVVKDGTAFVQTGAGIVADSQPAGEYRETLHKAGAMLAALGVRLDAGSD
jgi:anthranilate synthase component 1